MDTCAYCAVDLIVGDNWTAYRRNRSDFVCRRCASKISMGKLSRKDRLHATERKIGRPRKVEPDAPTPEFTRHNAETMTPERFAEKQRPRVHLATMMTPEVIAAISRPVEVTKVDLRDRRR